MGSVDVQSRAYLRGTLAAATAQLWPMRIQKYVLVCFGYMIHFVQGAAEFAWFQTITGNALHATRFHAYWLTRCVDKSIK
jgi:hypothetical protein